jgi:hypothetical protein
MPKSNCSNDNSCVGYWDRDYARRMARDNCKCINNQLSCQGNRPFDCGKNDDYCTVFQCCPGMSPFTYTATGNPPCPKMFSAVGIL